MFSYTLFELGPYKFCLWNLFALALIFLVATIMRRIIHHSLKKYLLNANIRLDGRRVTWLKLISQSVYVVAVYLSLLSFNINNDNVSLSEFLNYNIIDTKKIKINFYQIIIIGVIFTLAKMVINTFHLFISRKFKNDKDYNPSKEFVYIQLGKYVVYIFTLFFILETLNVDLTLFLGGSAALLVGLGLGLQDVFKDLFSGLVLLFEGSMKIGDVIELQDSKFKESIVAKIHKINVRTTQIETRDGNILMIPNTKLTQEYVENWSHGNLLSRFIIKVHVAYGSDTQKVSALLKQAALSHPKVKKSEPVLVRLTEFGTYSLNFELIFWADQSWEINNYKSDIRFEIDRLFRQYGIEIPIPKQEVFVRPNT